MSAFPLLLLALIFYNVLALGGGLVGGGSRVTTQPESSVASTRIAYVLGIILVLSCGIPTCFLQTCLELPDGLADPSTP